MHAAAASIPLQSAGGPETAPAEQTNLGGAHLSTFRDAHLVDADLRGRDLSGADLSGANLSRADLTGATLVGANLDGAVLFEATLDGAEFAASSCVGTNFVGATGQRVGFGACDLSDATLDRATLDASSFADAKLVGASLNGTSLERATLYRANLTKASLLQANLSHSDLREVDVDGAILDRADLRSANLFGVQGYDSASFIGTDLRDINFTGAYLLRRHAMDQNYIAEFRNRGRANSALYWVWWATSDCGRSLARWSFLIAILTVVFAFAYMGVALDYGDHRTALSPLYFSVVTMTTLGYGDVLPASAMAQTVAMVQVILGYLMLGGLLSIFSNKMARRAD